MQTKLLKYFIISITLTFVTWSCSKTTSTVDPQPTVLVSSTLVKELTKEQLITLLTPTLGAQASLFVRTGVKQYKVVYKTKNTDGTEIQASGALIIPMGTVFPDPLPLVSYQHGTIFDDKQAPSYYTQDGEGTIASLLASLGYIVAAPDYIGYGASNNLPHTYEQREGLATACLDMLRASKESITQLKANWNKNVFIAGYSEGGYATMSLQKKIEDEFPNEFNLKASSCGAGAYNKTLSFKTFISTKSSGDPQHNASYIWVLLTYNNIYKLNRPMSAYFIEPFATQITKEQQNARISGNFASLLSDAVKKGINDGTDTTLLNAVKDNDVFDWKPKTPTQLYHGTADTYVPFFNSQTAVDAMKKRGATNVELISIQGGEHGSSVQTYLLGTLSFFSGIK